MGALHGLGLGLLRSQRCRIGAFGPIQMHHGCIPFFQIIVSVSTTAPASPDTATIPSSRDR